MPGDFTFGIKLAPDPQPYETASDIEAQVAQNNLAKIQVRAAAQKQRQSILLSSVLKKHARIDPATGQPSIDNAAALEELYRNDPEVGMAYEDGLTKRAADRQAAAQAQEADKQHNAEYTQKNVTAALASVDTKSPDAPQQYGRAVARLEALGIQVPPEDREYNAAAVEQLQRQLIGPTKLLTEENDLAQNAATQTASTERSRIIAGGATDRARITSDASVQRARITADGGVARAQITADGGVTKAQIAADSKGTGTTGKGSSIDLLGDDAPDPTRTPFDGRFRMTSGIGPRKRPLPGASANHPGRDFAMPIGTPVPAKDDGVVVEAGPKSGYGQWVRVKFADGSEQGYGHLSQVSVKPGDRVGKGQVLALSGNSGTSTGPHTHVQDFGRPAASAGQSGDVADRVMRSTAPSRLSKGGQIALRTNPDVKAAQTMRVDSQINAINNAINVLKAGGQTGPGTDVRNATDRLLSGVRNVTGGAIDIGDAKKQEARINAYDVINSLSTTEAIAALAGIGGNDTDKDFERARATTVSNIRTRNYNMSTLATARELYKLQKDKAAFTTKWANLAGDPNQTINGQTLGQAWDAYASNRMKRIGQFAKENGLYGSTPRKAATKAPAPAAPTNVKPKGAVGVRDRQGNYYWEMPDGSHIRVRK